ncbi:MAG: Gfo/Idh/MocA family oxidoreductase [Rhodospirillaceae bacterium]|jgi:predicted dehydrogenase|nr:Gfo/Idh/MocA family oxidoreductase [Rhodospirillaceae bacterium]
MINAALFGLGRWGSVLLNSIQGADVAKSDKIEITTGIARSLENYQDLASKTGIELSDDYTDVLADPAIHAVLLATPPFAHAEQIMAAAKAGKHVFVEKPFTLDVAEAKRAVQACQEAGVILAVGFNRRYYPSITALTQMIEEGRIGEVQHIEAHFCGITAMSIPEDSWRGERANNPAGGMVARGIHCLDSMIHLCGDVESVSVDSDRRISPADIDDVTTMLLRFKSGVTGYLATLMSTGEYWRLQVFGSKGWIELRSPTELLVSDVKGNTERVTYPDIDWQRTELENFADAITGERPFYIKPEQALHGVEVLEAISASINSGARVDID